MGKGAKKVINGGKEGALENSVKERIANRDEKRFKRGF